MATLSQEKLKQTFERDLLNLLKNFSADQFKILFDKFSAQQPQYNSLRINNTYPLIPFLIKSGIDEKSLSTILQHIFKRKKASPSDFDHCDSFGWSAVHYAVLKNYSTTLSELTSIGFKVDTASTEQLKPDDYYYLPKTTPLQICAWHGNVSLAKHLLTKGADINTVNNSGWNLLLIACHENRKEFVEYLLEKGLSPNSQSGSKQPLHVCARWNFKDLIQVLVNAKANIDAVNLYGQTPLLVAITNSNKETANELIRCGAYVHTLDKFNNNLLHIIAETNLVEVAYNLIKSGVDLNARNNKQLTPLHVSSKKGNTEMAKIFLENGANIDEIDNNGDTALMMACESGFNAMVEFLLAKNANKDIYNSQGYAALHLCVTENRLDTFKVLIEAGDGCNKPEMLNSKSTPLHMAIEAGNEQIFDYLVIDKKALSDINYQDSDGVTPLYLAAVKGSKVMVETLLKAGAKVNKTATKKKKTAMHACAQSPNCHTAIIRLLLEYGAEISAEDDDQMSALACAAACGNYAAAKYLVERKASHVNSRQETVFHVCARANALDTKTATYLISVFGIDALFTSANASPLHEIVYNHSHCVFTSLMQCHNITFGDWVRLLVQPSMAGISVLEYAVLFGDFEFIKMVIALWYARFHDLHADLHADAHIGGFHSLVFANKDDAATTSSCFFACTSKPSENNSPHLRYSSCLMGLLLHENAQLALEILNTLIYVSKQDWKTKFFIDHIEQTFIEPQNPNGGSLSLLEYIFFKQDYSCILHPCIRICINEKFKWFGVKQLKLTLIRHFLLLFFWTIFFVTDPTYHAFEYSLRDTFGSVVKTLCYLATVGVITWDILEGWVDFRSFKERYRNYEKWLKDKYSFNPYMVVTDDGGSNAVPRSKKSLVMSKPFVYEKICEKQMQLFSTLQTPYANGSQYFDWTCRLVLILSILTHFLDILHHCYLFVKLYAFFTPIAILLQWIRFLYSIRLSMSKIGDLVTMIKLTIDDISRFLVIFFVVYIPYALVFWRLYGSRPMNDLALMNRDCLIGEQALNCTSVTITGMENMRKTFYTVFRILVGDPYEYDKMMSVDPYVTTVLCASFVIIVAMVLLNFFIGLITGILNSEAFNKVEKHRFMEKLKFSLLAEWREPYGLRVKYYERIRERAESEGPLIVELNQENFGEFLNEKNSSTVKPILRQSRKYSALPVS